MDRKSNALADDDEVDDGWNGRPLLTNILVSRTRRGLWTAGSGLEFNEIGQPTFDGIDGKPRLLLQNQQESYFSIRHRPYERPW